MRVPSTTPYVRRQNPPHPSPLPAYRERRPDGQPLRRVRFLSCCLACAAAAADPAAHRPFLAVLSNCTRVLVRGVALTDSPMFHLVPRACTDVTVDAVHFVDHATNVRFVHSTVAVTSGPAVLGDAAVTGLPDPGDHE